MLNSLNRIENVYLISGYADLRKGIDGLADIVKNVHSLDLFGLNLFLFCGRRTDRFKALYFDGEGFILFYKRYDQGKLKWPRQNNEIKCLSKQQVTWLFEGLSITQKPSISKATIGYFI